MAQRDIAFVLADGEKYWVSPNPIQACAWRTVVLLSGHPQVKQDDADAKRLACDDLDPAAAQAALGRASAIYTRVLSRRFGLE